MRKFLKYFCLITLVLAAADYFLLYSIPWPELTKASASYLSLKRAATCFYLPGDTWDEGDKLMGSGVFLGVNDPIRGRRVFLLSGESLGLEKLGEKDDARVKFAFQRGMMNLGVKHFTLPQTLRKRVFEAEDGANRDFSIIEITDAVEELEKRGAEIKYLNLDLDHIGIPSDLTKSHDARSISGVGISDATSNPDLRIGVGVGVYAIAANEKYDFLINPYRKIHNNPLCTLKGKLVHIEHMENGLRYYEVDFPSDKFAIGSPVFTDANYKGIEYPYFLGVIAGSHGNHTLVIPVDRIKEELILERIKRGN